MTRWPCNTASRPASTKLAGGFHLSTARRCKRALPRHHLGFLFFEAPPPDGLAAHFGWDTRAAGLSLAAYGLMHALAQAFLTGPISRALGERRAVVLSVMMDVAGFAAMAWISAGWMVYPTMVVLCMAEIGMPALQAMLSRQVGDHEQGELQGALASLASVAAMIGPLAATAVYAMTAPVWSGTVWLLGALLNGVCLVLLMGGAARRAARA